MTLKLAVVGKNISYSLSPLIHAAFAESLGITIDYSIQDTQAGSFEEKIRYLQKSGFHGCNITVPFKEEAFKLADEASDFVLQAGAANTFVFRPDQTIFADNTDGRGLVQDITHNIGFSLAQKRILICGAGGAVRGILGPILLQKPERIVLANRSTAKADGLANLFKNRVRACDYAALAHQIFDAVIDGTSLKTDILPIPETLALAENALVYDLKYCTGVETAMMQWARAKGAEAVYDGTGMLVEQAAQSFYLWTGYRPVTAPLICQLKSDS